MGGPAGKECPLLTPLGSAPASKAETRLQVLRDIQHNPPPLSKKEKEITLLHTIESFVTFKATLKGDAIQLNPLTFPQKKKKKEIIYIKFFFFVSLML